MRKRMGIALFAIVFCLGMTACNGTSQSSEKVNIQNVNDKIAIFDYGFVEEHDDNGTAHMTSLKFKICNISDETLSFDSLVIVAYDDNMNQLELAPNGEGFELGPNEKSKAIKFSISEPARAAEVIGYTYKDKDKVCMDFLYEPLVLMGDDE